MTAQTDPLLEAVEALTKPQSRKEPQDIINTYVTKDDEGVETEHQKVVGTQKVTVILPPLLKQLDDAIRSSMGGSTRGAALASESAVLNVSALYEAMKIESQVRDWCRLRGITPTKDTAKDLAAWHAATYLDGLTDEQETSSTRTLRKWATSIRGMLDPWREKDLPDPCPACGATDWWDMSTRSRYLRPLIIKYRPDGADMVERSYGLCRACEEVWNVRELAYDIEQAAQHADA
ncbi:hypothetical protein [Leifsonia sp. NPDC058248]|uniref:DUF7341 domain-containing protein n=1 Tax=Leifsonia sp. NPDC058248 TaxID=3346402 RepID=UPI0036D9D932